MAEPILTIPHRHRERFAELLAFPGDRLSSLAEAFEGATLSSLSASDLAEQIASRAGMTQRETVRTVNLLTSIYYLPDLIPSLTREGLVAELMSAIEADEKLSEKAADLSAFRGFLERTLALEDPIGLLSKGTHLITGHERTFGAARIFSDLRALFGADDPGRPLAFIVDHVLQIHYHKGSTGEETYISLRRKDLSALAKVIQRAEEKEKELRKLAEALGIQFLEGGDE